MVKNLNIIFINKVNKLLKWKTPQSAFNQMNYQKPAINNKYIWYLSNLYDLSFLYALFLWTQCA